MGGNADIQGEVTVDTYIGSGNTGWRFLAPQVKNKTVADWNDDFFTSGFTGSDYPGYFFTSIYSFDEELGGTFDEHFQPIQTVNHPLIPGDGLYVWSGDNLSSTNSFIIDLKGEVNKGTIVLPVSLSGMTNNDGWCLISNPYPCLINWQSDQWIKHNISESYYIWNPQVDQFAAYTRDPETQIESFVNGGSRYISSGQAFFVRTTGPNPILIANEGVKIKHQKRILRRRRPKENSILFQLKDETSVLDEAILNLNNLPSSWNIQKLNNTELQTSVSFKQQYEYAILSVDDTQLNKIPFYIKNPEELDTYLNIDVTGKLPECTYLVDNVLNKTYYIKKDTIFPIDGKITSDRFEIVTGISTPNIIVENMNCNNYLGSVLVEQKESSIQLIDKNGTVIQYSMDNLMNDQLDAGEYTITSQSEKCPINTQNIEIMNTKVVADWSIDKKQLVGTPLNVFVTTDDTNTITISLNGKPIEQNHILDSIGILEVVVKVSNGICLKIFSDSIQVYDALSGITEKTTGEWGIDFNRNKIEFFNDDKSFLGSWKLVGIDGNLAYHGNNLYLSEGQRQLFHLPYTLSTGIYVLVLVNESYGGVKTLKISVVK